MEIMSMQTWLYVCVLFNKVFQFRHDWSLNDRIQMTKSSGDKPLQYKQRSKAFDYIVARLVMKCLSAGPWI